ncbi:hypothetical protein C8Q75DRAFT_539770 [Abortiporus biennis]|nr:hypothetical protein C8Q75DRAFT_539770 [Abortiporus biennis]
MFSNLCASVALSVALASIPWANAQSQPNPQGMSRHFIMGGNSPLVSTRLDPIVSPNAISSHEHTIFGGANFGPTYDYDTYSSADCTTVSLDVDFSNYWVPSWYYHDPNGTFSMIPAVMNIYYFMRPGDGEVIVAPPKGLRMIAGSPTRTTYNASNHEDQAVSFVCLDYSGAHNGDPDYAERPDFFDHNCANGVRGQVFFPQCWDGKNLDSADHKSHMAYPVDAYNGGKCPDSHPVHIFGIFYEFLVSTDQFPYNGAGSWALSTGDTRGLTFHGDFAMGWSDAGIQALTDAANTCATLQGDINTCPPLKAHLNANAHCVYPGQIVQEDIGDKHPINNLPGCNDVWDLTGPKPTCASSSASAIVDTQTPILTGWSEFGCVAEASSGRALSGASYVDANNMTQNSCAAFCGQKGFKYAGVEWSQECYCGNSFSNSASGATLAAPTCNMPCKGNEYQACGGSKLLTVLVNDGGKSQPVSGSASVVTSSVATSTTISSSVSTSSKTAGTTLIVVPTSSVSTTGKLSSSISVSTKTAGTTVIVTPTTSTIATTGKLSSSISLSTKTAGTTLVVTATSSLSLPAPTGIPAGWTAAGCVTDGTPRALGGATIIGSNTSIASCTQACNSRGFTIAGLEFGQECYCGNSFQNAGQAVDASQCNMACASGSGTCGGNWVMNIYKKSGHVAVPTSVVVTTVQSSTATSQPTAVASSLPNGWTPAGCYTDSSHRTLNQSPIADNTVNIESCITHCNKAGFTIAGLEYGHECYCGNSFLNGGKKTDNSQCFMPCAAGGSGNCGGNWALNVFTKTSAAKRSIHHRRHLGSIHHSAF